MRAARPAAARRDFAKLPALAFSIAIRLCYSGFLEDGVPCNAVLSSRVPRKGPIMNAQLLAYTQPNPALTPESAAGASDLAALWQGKGTYAENVVEYAGRVCYRSTRRMGSAPDFIAARVREGHEDIIEHVVATVRFTDVGDEPLRWRLLNRHCEVSDLGGGAWLVSGNTRVWVDFFRRGVALAALLGHRQIRPRGEGDDPRAGFFAPVAQI